MDTLAATPPAPTTRSRMATGPAQLILHAYESGQPALLVTGRSLYDLVADDQERVLTVAEHLRREARARHGMHLVTYSLSQGLDWDSARIADERDRRTVEAALREHGLLNVSTDDREVVRVMRGIASLARTWSNGLAWADGSPLRFLLLLEFADHLTPSGEQGGRTDHEIATVELSHVLGQSNALRQSGNLVVFHGREGRIDQLVVEALHQIRLRQPDAVEKAQFIQAARRLHPAALFEAGVSDSVAANLSANTPNRGLESRLRRSAREGTPVAVADLLGQKRDDVVKLSEGTLTVLDTQRVEGVTLVGRNIDVPQTLLRSFGAGLLQGNLLMPANCLLTGPPGLGKTDLALIAAREAQASAYQISSPKGGIVGETERRAALMTRALAEWTPNVAFADEITEMLPTERSDFDGDSGASRAVMAALLTALSDESRRGRSLLIGTTNCPWRMGAALRSRFTTIPVLSPLAEDYPAIIAVVVTRLAPAVELDVVSLHEAGQRFYDKGASPREILGAISLALAFGAPPRPETILEAAMDLCAQADRSSAEYADLWAVKACGSQRFLPWHRCVEAYPFPPHLAGLVHPVTGELDREELDRRIATLKPRANL